MDPLLMRCPICEAEPGAVCERFDHIAAVFVPLGYHHHGRTQAAEAAGVQPTLFPINSTDPGRYTR